MVTIAVFGVGDVGQSILRGLATYKEITRICAFSLNAQRLEAVAADIAAIACYRDINLEIVLRTLDMRNITQLAETLAVIKPDIIVNSATLRAWWVPTKLPPEIQRKLQLDAGIGPLLPIHLTLALNLMKAQTQAVKNTPVVNVAFPDVVNPVLGKLNLAPACGAGNSEFLYAGIKYIAARRLGVPMREIDVQMVGHHFHCNYFWTGLEGIESLENRPCWICVLHHDKDVTAQLNPMNLLMESGRLLPRGRVLAVRTGESAVKNIMRLVRDDPTVTHVVGPFGYGGGYDARLRRDSVEIVLPTHLSLEDAQKINERAQIGDGIQAIEPFGTVIFTEKASSAMKQILGYDCPMLKPEDSEARAVELLQRLDGFKQTKEAPFGSS